MISRIVIVALLAGISFSLPVELSVQNALIRTGLWIALFIVAMSKNWIWQVGPSQWFMIMQFTSYGTWPAFYIVGYYFFRYTAYYPTVVLRDAEPNALQVDTGTFLFTCIAWTILSLFGPKVPPLDLEDKCGKQLYSPNLGSGTLLGLLILGSAGALALLLSQFMPSVLVQPVRLFGTFFFAAIAYLCIFSSPHDAGVLRFRWPICLTLCFGVLAFAGSGLKQMIFVTLLQLIWFIAGNFPRYRKSAMVISCCILAAFITLLPVFQYAKREFLNSGSASETFGALVKGFKTYSDSGSLDDKEPTSAASMWRYLGNRVCLAVLPQIYHRNYKDHPQGYETFRVALGSLVPRILDPNKQSIDEYFNDLARESGIGNKSDRKTSRKPCFVDESIIVWGSKGFYIGGLVFGVYLVLLERGFALLSRNSTELIVIRFALLTLGQIPYSGVLIVALAYNLPFIGLILLPTIRRFLDPNSEIAEFLVRQRRLKGGASA